MAHKGLLLFDCLLERFLHRWNMWRVCTEHWFCLFEHAWPIIGVDSSGVRLFQLKTPPLVLVYTRLSLLCSSLHGTLCLRRPEHSSDVQISFEVNEWHSLMNAPLTDFFGYFCRSAFILRPFFHFRRETLELWTNESHLWFYFVPSSATFILEDFATVDSLRISSTLTAK